MSTKPGQGQWDIYWWRVLAAGIRASVSAPPNQRPRQVRRIERIPAGSTLSEIARSSKKIIDRASIKTLEYSQVYIDLTGFGTPGLEYMQRLIFCGHLTPVHFHHGDQLRQQHPNVHIGKAYLVTRYQLLLQSGRLHLPSTAEVRLLAQELQEDQLHDPTGNDYYGAFAVGTRDELVTALGMAVCGAMRPKCWVMRMW